MKAHPTNPFGVLVPCADCGKELHLPKAEMERTHGDIRCVRCGAERFLPKIAAQRER